MAWLFEYCTDGTNWIEIPETHIPLDSFKVSRQIHRDLRPSVDACEFTIVNPPATVINTFVSADVTSRMIQVRITKDTVAIFKGWIESEVDSEIEFRTKEISVRCFDESWKLDRAIGDALGGEESKSLKNYKVYDSSDKSHSILYYILHNLYGLEESRITPVNITTTIDYFMISKDETYQNILAGLLSEFGYVFYFDASGAFCTQDLFPTSLTTIQAFDDGNIYRPINWAKKTRSKDGAEITWWPHETLTNQIVFSDTSGGDTLNKSNIEVDVNDYGTNPNHWPYYPRDFVPAGSTTPAENPYVYCDYKIADREIILVDESTVIPDILSDDATNLKAYGTPKYYATKAYFIWKNLDTLATHHILKFDLKGTALVKGNKHIERKYIVSDQFQNLEKIETKYITNQAQAKRLTIGLCDYFQYSNITYQFEAAADYAVGSLATFENSASGIGQSATLTVRILQKTTGYQADGTPVYLYSVEGMNAFNISAVVNSETRRTPATIFANPTADTSGVLTKTEDQEGYDDPYVSGGTTVPMQPTIIECAPVGIRGIRVMWQRNDTMLKLTNFSHYEIAVSEDNITFYEPYTGSDGQPTSWRTGAGFALSSPSASGAVVAVEQYIHSNVPTMGTLSAPTGKLLYYVVRTVTKKLEKSDWSTFSSATTKVVSPGDIAANSIYANAIIAGEITGDKIKAGTITADNIIENGITDRKVARVSEGDTASTTSKSWVDLGGLTITYTGLPANCAVLMLFNANSIAASQTFRIYNILIQQYINFTDYGMPAYELCMDGIPYANSYIYSSIVGQSPVAAVAVFDSIPAGTHIFTVKWKKTNNPGYPYTDVAAQCGARNLICYLFRK